MLVNENGSGQVVLPDLDAGEGPKVRHHGPKRKRYKRRPYKRWRRREGFLKTAPTSLLAGNALISSGTDASTPHEYFTTDP
ncbi:hypothetical protein EVAR_92099_1 [Eumeta japonica]|uniref:Uncharacterized protein n=1 Tax=Eumeta variegata TaxID=151549 RepID=A0A4C1T0Z7_EUMVA|nr:hypothetical protein EVAR_92099_1 [Eumeta japonica]